MKKITALYLSVFLLTGVFAQPMKAEAKENIVIAIDPGHGGTNLGAQPAGGYLEKNLTMVTALAMKEELEKYEGVTVYLTRTADVDLSLDDRAVIAQSVNADFLFSVHYNMSANHNFYGSEVWAQATGDYYTKGYSVGNLLLEEFGKYFGTFNRGVKVKLNSRGTEYYGVLRAASERGIPAVIIEHCHLDHQNDTGYANTIEKLQSFGRADATAVAKYYGLRSAALQVDYIGHKKASIPPQAAPMIQDLTPPEVASVQVSPNAAPDRLKLTIHAADSNTGILYYSYTVNGGTLWSPLQPWSSSNDLLTVEVPTDTGGNRIAAVRVFNAYDGMTESLPVAY